jgi:hypothetical protein
MRKTSLLTIVAMVAMSPFALAADVTVTMNQIDEKGVGKALGTIEFDDGKEGLVIKTKLTGLPPGEHGLHVHEGGGSHLFRDLGKIVFSRHEDDRYQFLSSIVQEHLMSHSWATEDGHIDVEDHGIWKRWRPESF